MKCMSEWDRDRLTQNIAVAFPPRRFTISISMNMYEAQGSRRIDTETIFQPIVVRFVIASLIRWEVVIQYIKRASIY